MDVYVLAMEDKLDDSYTGPYVAVFATFAEANQMMKRWISDEIEDGTITEKDVNRISDDCVVTTNDRFTWTITNETIQW